MSILREEREKMDRQIVLDERFSTLETVLSFKFDIEINSQFGIKFPLEQRKALHASARKKFKNGKTLEAGKELISDTVILEAVYSLIPGFREAVEEALKDSAGNLFDPL